MSPYRTRLQVKLAANAASVPLNKDANVEPSRKKYNTRFQAALTKERMNMVSLMNHVDSNNDHTNIDAMRACFEYLQTSQKLWKHYPQFRTAVNDKIHDMLVRQIPNRLSNCASESEIANKLVQLRCAIEQLREIMNNYYTQQYWMYDE